MSSKKGLIEATAAIGFVAFLVATAVGATQITPPLPSAALTRVTILGTLGKGRLVPRSLFATLAAL